MSMSHHNRPPFGFWLVLIFVALPLYVLFLWLMTLTGVR